MKSAENKGRIYLDVAAATPISLPVKAAMLPYLDTFFGNASAVHAEGRAAKQAINDARQKIARTLGVRGEEIIFTGSGTEANNLAVLGYVHGLAATGRSYASMAVVMSEIEHPSLLNLVPVLTKLGVKVSLVPVTVDGHITVPALESVLTPETVLVAFAYANSEIGTIQKVSRLVKVIRAFAARHDTTIKVHLDAAQAPLWLPCQSAPLGVDSLALDAGKCFGPKGVGILFAKHRSEMVSLMLGGGQEGGLRPGTENVAGIVGAAEAFFLAQHEYEERARLVHEVSAGARAYLEIELPQAVINGSHVDRLPNNINFSLPGFDTEYAVVWLDAHGIAASTKSACAGAGGGMSHVVYACTKDTARARSTIRFSLSPDVSLESVRHAIDVLRAFCQKMNSLTH